MQIFCKHFFIEKNSTEDNKACNGLQYARNEQGKTGTYFQAADTRREKGEKPTLDREEFVNFYNLLTERPEIEELFLK